MEPDRSPAQLIADSEGLLLDFDGPVCDVYAGSDPARIAREVAAAFDLDIDTDDPLDLIGHALATRGPVDAIHESLTQTEIEAVRTATETPGIRQLVEAYHRPIGIVSNNGREAIARWLTQSGLGRFVSVIVGRDPRHMKPDPTPLQLAARQLGLPVAQCAFVGDSASDAVAAEKAGAPMVALANRPQKREWFSGGPCAVIVEDVWSLVPERIVPPHP